MKKTVLRYALYSAITMVILFTISFLLFRGFGYAGQEVVGYASIIISQLFVFFAIKHYRDRHNGGQVSFGKGMKVGLLIVLVPSFIFGLFSVLYATVIDPDFNNKYYNQQLAELQKSLPPAEFEKQRAIMESQKAMFDNPAFNFILMFLTVFVIGVIITVISSLILRRNDNNAKMKGAMA